MALLTGLARHGNGTIRDFDSIEAQFFSAAQILGINSLNQGRFHEGTAGVNVYLVSANHFDFTPQHILVHKDGGAKSELDLVNVIAGQGQQVLGGLEALATVNDHSQTLAHAAWW